MTIRWIGTSHTTTRVSVIGACPSGYCFDLGRGRIEGIETSDTGDSATVLQVSGSLVVRDAVMSGGPGQVGVYARSIRITNAVVTGHGIDLASRSLRPVGVTCDRSRRFGKDGFVVGSWGVCAND